MTPMGVKVSMTDKPALLEWISFFILNNYSKFEVNIFGKDRDIRKRLKILSRKRGITMAKG